MNWCGEWVVFEIFDSHTFAFSPKIPTECSFPFAFTFSELTFMNDIHELDQLLNSDIYIYNAKLIPKLTYYLK
jgi:hypothetical protein